MIFSSTILWLKKKKNVYIPIILNPDSSMKYPLYPLVHPLYTHHSPMFLFFHATILSWKLCRIFAGGPMAGCHESGMGCDSHLPMGPNGNIMDVFFNFTTPRVFVRLMGIFFLGCDSHISTKTADLHFATKKHIADWRWELIGSLKKMVIIHQ